MLVGMSVRKRFESNMRIRVSAWLLLGLGYVGSSAAHDFWIEPSAFDVTPGEEVSLVLRVGQDFAGNSQPYIPNWFVDYSVTGEQGARPVDGTMGDDPAGRFIAEAPGIEVVGYHSTPDFVELDAERFLAYLKVEGLDGIIRLREERGEAQKPAPEYYSRCAKSLVRVGGGRGGHDQVLGYTLELIPARDPYGMRPGDELPVRLLYRSQPLPDALVIAFTADDPGQKLTARTDRDGRVSLVLPKAGVWLVKAVHMIETPPDDPGADWESFWASLTFEMPSR
jgi:uncharacterized GH25 family protein